MPLMMHIVAGYPTLQSSRRIALKILELGADFLEIQIPFSDPIADGPVIAAANNTALKNGVSLKASFRMIKSVTHSTKKPVFIMTYFNLIHRYGVKKFCKRARAGGVIGLIVPDYPFDEETGNGLLKYCRKNRLSFIPVIASTTRNDRIKVLVQCADRFVYCVSRSGTTGQKTVIDAPVIEYLKRVRAHCPLPIAVGFGIATKAQMEALKFFADIAVVGSALIQEYSKRRLREIPQVIENFMRPLSQKSINLV